MPRTRRTPLDLDQFLDSSAFPIYVLDEDRRIVFLNEAGIEWVGLTADELVGTTCQYHSEAAQTGPAEVAARLCPPPAAFGGQRQTAEVSALGRGGRLVRRRGEFLPLAEGADSSAGVLAILEPFDLPDDDSPGDNLPGDRLPTAGDAPVSEPLPTQLHARLARFRQEWANRYDVDGVVGDTPAMARVRAQVAMAALNSANVLILGPSGSGKEHVAKAIHFRDRGAGARALVPLDCAALVPELLTSTLAALVSKHAAPDSAAVKAASLLLNDVDALPAAVQGDFSRVLKKLPPSLRVLSTSTERLERLVEQDHFSAELACQLSTLVIALPPLADRLDDLPLLAQMFLERSNVVSGKKVGKQVGGFSTEALDRLAAYPWPGNLDELATMVRQAHGRCQSTRIEAADLPPKLQLAAQAARHARPDEGIALEAFLARVETELIQRALRRAKGNKSKAAKLLGLTRPRLYRRLVQLGLEKGADEDLGDEWQPSD